MRISELNRAIDSFAAKRVDLKTVRDYSAEERVVDKSEARQSRVTDARGWEWCHAVLVQAVRQAMRNEGIADPEESEINERIRMQYIEPDSGLYNSAAFEVISQAKFTARRLGEPLSVGYLDGNKIGAFIKSYGFLGDTMVDTIVCRRISSTASDVLAQYGVALFRVGPRSEEFYLLGNVSSEVMAKAVKRFNAQVNRPLKFKVTEAEMMATTDGARFMALLLRRPGVYSDSQGCYLHIDLTELPREEGRFSRLSFTGAVMNIGRNLAQTILTVIERAEAAKSTNETREYLLINLDAA
jgi:GGDEF domain-containing protein